MTPPARRVIGSHDSSWGWGASVVELSRFCECRRTPLLGRLVLNAHGCSTATMHSFSHRHEMPILRLCQRQGRGFAREQRSRLHSPPARVSEMRKTLHHL